MPIDAVIALFVKHPTLTSLKVFRLVVLEVAIYILENNFLRILICCNQSTMAQNFLRDKYVIYYSVQWVVKCFGMNIYTFTISYCFKNNYISGLVLGDIINFWHFKIQNLRSIYSQKISRKTIAPWILQNFVAITSALDVV